MTRVMIVVALLAGCAAEREYTRPDAPRLAEYKELAGWKRAEPADEIPRGRWWAVFGDPVLNDLAARVDVSNQTVRISEAQLRQAEALSRQARAALFPVITGNAAMTRSRPAVSPGRPGVGTVESYSASAGTSWEVDLWGRLRSALAATQANLAASTADLEAVRLSVQAALVQNYFLLRVADAQRRLLADTVDAYRRSVELTRNRYAAGVAARADIVQAESQLKSTEAQLIDVGVQRAAAEHAIAVLAGVPPGSVAVAPLAAAFKLPVIPVGVPSSLLERRPDIAAAERRVAAANSQIGVSEGALFPALTLGASAGLASSSFADWLTLPARFWSVGPALAHVLFDGGQRRAQVEQARAAYDAVVAQYRQIVLTGFQEVEDNLAALRILEEEAAVQAEAVRLGRESVELTLNQYKAGLVSFLNVVTVQTQALANERTAVAILGRRLTAAVNLVRAIGGGWQAE